VINKIIIMISHGKIDQRFNVSDIFCPDLDSWDVRIDSPPVESAQWVKVSHLWGTNQGA